jgi:hypothetical protein
VIGAIVGVLVVVWTRWRGQRKDKAGVVVLAVVLIAIALTSWSESLLRARRVAGETDHFELSHQPLGRCVRLVPATSALRVRADVLTRAVPRHHRPRRRTQRIGQLLIDTGILGAVTWLALLAAILIIAMRLSLTSPGLQSRDRCMILALTLAMIANAVFTEGLGAPANVTCTWLFVINAWLNLAGHRSDGEQP